MIEKYQLQRGVKLYFEKSKNKERSSYDLFAELYGNPVSFVKIIPFDNKRTCNLDGSFLVCVNTKKGEADFNIAHFTLEESQ
jgi:hypothetical protein